MVLVQILLPLADNDGKPFPDSLLGAIQSQLTDTFGGVTAFSRAPAEGIWRQGGGHQHDDIVMVEVMTASLDRGWWKSFRLRLEKDLRQEAILIRAQSLEML